MKNPNLLFATNSSSESPSYTVNSLGKMLVERNVNWGATHKSSVDYERAIALEGIHAGFTGGDFDSKNIATIKVFTRLPKDIRPNLETVPIVNPDWLSELTVDKMAIARLIPEISIPTELLYTSQTSLDQVRRTVTSMIERFPDCTHFVVKPRSGSGSEGVTVYSAEDLFLLVTTNDPIASSLWQKNMIIQPLIDRSGGEKPYLPDSLCDKPSTLRILGGGIVDANNNSYTDLSMAMYRVDSGLEADSTEIADPMKETNIYLTPSSGQNLYDQYPKLRSAFDCARQTIEALLASRSAIKYASERTTHGFRPIHVAVDMIQAPDRTYVLEVNSSPQRVAEEDVNIREIAQRVEANVLSAATHRTIPVGEQS